MIKLSFPKNNVVSGKTAFFVIAPFCTPHSTCLLTLIFDRAALYGNAVL